MPQYIPRSELYYNLGVLFLMPSQSERRTEDKEDQQGDPEPSGLMVFRKVLFSLTSSLLVSAHMAAVTTAATTCIPHLAASVSSPALLNLAYKSLCV